MMIDRQRGGYLNIYNKERTTRVYCLDLLDCPTDVQSDAELINQNEAGTLSVSTIIQYIRLMIRQEV